MQVLIYFKIEAVGVTRTDEVDDAEIAKEDVTLELPFCQWVILVLTRLWSCEANYCEQDSL